MALEGYSKLNLIVSDDGTIKKWENDAISLQKQVRYLRQELSNTSYNDAQKQSVKLLLSEAERGLEATKARSTELFGQLALIPGPIGQMATQANQAYIAFRSLSQLNFSDLKTTLKIMGESIFGATPTKQQQLAGEGGMIGAITQAASAGIGGAIGAGSAGKGGTAGTSASGTFGKVGQSLGGGMYNEEYIAYLDAMKKIDLVGQKRIDMEAVRTGQLQNYSVARTAQLRTEYVEYSKNVEAAKAAEKAYSEFGPANQQLARAAENLSSQFKDLGVQVSKGKLSIDDNKNGLRELNATEIAAAASGKQLIITSKGTVIAFTEATIATKAWDFALKGLVLTAQAFLVILAAIGGAIAGIAIAQFFREWALGANAAAYATSGLEAQIKSIQGVLELDLTDMRKRQSDKLGLMKAGNASEIELRAQGLKDAQENYKLTTKALKDARIAEAEAMGDFGTVKAERTKRYKEELAGFKGNLEDRKILYTNYLRDFNEIRKREEGRKGGALGMTEEDAKKELENVKAAQKLRQDLEKKQIEGAAEINTKGYDKIDTENKKRYNDALRDLDAQIALELGKENTRTTELEALYKKRNKLIDNYNVNITLSEAEKEDRLKTQRKTAILAEIDDDLIKKQAAVDAAKRQTEELSLNTKEYFDARKNVIDAEFVREMKEAEKLYSNKQAMETAQENAKTKQFVALRNLEIERLQSRVTLIATQLNGEYNESLSFFKKQKELLDAKYKADIAAARGNKETLLAIEKEYNQKINQLNVTQERTYIATKKQQNEALVELQKLTGIDLTQNIFDINKQQSSYDKIYFDQKRTVLKEEYDNEKQLTEENSEARKQLDLKYSRETLAITKEELESKRKVRMMEVDWAIQIADILTNLGAAFFKNNKDVQKALVAITGAAQIAKIIATTEAGLAAARAEAAAVALIPGVNVAAAAALVAVETSTRIGQAISIASVLAAKAAAWAQIDSGGAGGGEGSGADQIVRGKNYGAGGMIEGPKHTQGGVPATLEGGESIINARSTTMFAPLLSMLNQAGGGAAFNAGVMGQAPFDNPRVVNSPTEPQIIKTYIVQSELTSMAEKQSRLKSLSTL